MKLQNIKEQLLTELAKEKCLQQYKISKKDFAFKKSDKEVELMIDFTNNHWPDEIHLFPYVYIKIKKVHEICNMFNFDLNYTAFINLFILEKVVNGEFDEDTRWKLQSEFKDRFILLSEDISDMMVKMKQFLSYAMDYIHENTTIEAIDKMYNENPTYEYNPNCSDMSCHCVIGMIAAKLSNNPNFLQLTNTYSDIVNSKPRGFVSEEIDSFNRIKEYLINM